MEQRHMGPDTPHRGFTLIEALVTLAVAAILLSLAAPSFWDLIVRNRLKSAGEAVYSQLQFARQAGIKSSSEVRVHFFTDGSTRWCVGLDDDLSSDCHCSTAPAACTLDGAQKVLEGDDFLLVTASQDFDDDDTRFNPRRAVPEDEGTVTLSAGDNSVKVVLNVVGRVSLCADDLPGYPGC